MGFLRHGNRTIEMDDLVLAHLQVVLAARTRDGEDPLLVWHEADGVGAVPVSLRLDRTVPTWFVFTGDPPERLQEQWLRRLDRFRASVVLTDEHGELVVLPAADRS